MPLIRSRAKKSGNTSGNSKSPNWVIVLIATFGIIFYFILGSWQLSFVIDQIKCKNKTPGCLLPSDPDSIPYRSMASGLMDVFKKATSAGKNWTVLEILKKIFSIIPKNKSPMRGGSNQTKISNNISTKPDINMFRPFDISNGPVGWPYSWAEEPSEWQTGYFSQWFGEMQIKSWSASRGLLSGYLSIFNSLVDNIVTRFLLTWMMPIIILLVLVFQPLISFCTCIWANLSAGIIPWGIVFFFVPIFTIITTLVQHFQLMIYVITGGFKGSGLFQVAKNLNLDTKKGYGRIIQAIMALGLLITMILFIMDKTKKAK